MSDYWPERRDLIHKVALQELEDYMVGKGGAAQISIRSLRKRVLRRHPSLEDNYNLTKTIYNFLEELPWAKYWGDGYRQTTKNAVVRRIYQLKISPSRTKARSCPAVMA